jgi:tetratricopeptide (TPR) repeat protein
VVTNRRNSARSLLLTCLVGVVALAGVAPLATAQGDEEPIDLQQLAADRMAKARKYPLGRRVSRYLSASADLIDEDKPDEAEALLLKLAKRRLNPYERAYVYRMLGVVAYTAEEHAKAIEYFKEVLAQEALPIRDESKIRFTIAQLYAQLEDWPQVIAWLETWRRYLAQPVPDGIYLMALAYYQMGDYDAAIAKTKEAISLSDEPRENWYKMLYALYTQKQDYESATPVLEELLLRYPKKQYWVQLSLVYGAREDYDVSLAVQQMAYEQGFLTEDKELRRLARSYLYRDLPYPAAQVLEKGLADGQIEPDSEAYELLANSWIAAREFDRALPPLKKAAELSDDGNLYVRLGQVHLQREQWEEAARNLQKALDKGDLRNEGNAMLLAGIALYNDSKAAQAKRYFARARKFDATRAEADRWIDHIARENGSQSG